MEKKFRFINNEINVEQTDTNKMIVGGYLCHYNERNRNGQLDLPGCYDEFLNDWKNKKINLPLVLNHNEENTNDVIGLFFHLENNDKGIYGKAEIIETPYIKNEIWPKIKAGVWPFFSTGGFSFDNVFRDNLNWDCIKGYLTHVSLVSFGADENANIEILNKLNKDFHKNALKLNIFDINLLNK